MSEVKDPPIPNPYRKLGDLATFPLLRNFIKAYYKNYHFFGIFGNLPKKSHHHIIVEANKNHGAIILGALPTREALNKRLKGVIRVSMLTPGEERGMGYVENSKNLIVHIPLVDRSIMDPTTGRNITFKKFSQEMEKLKKIAQKKGKDIYFHCMAGKSRSVIAVIAYLYLNDIKTGLKDELPSEIVKLIKSKRSQAKSLWKFEKDQTGFLGLMTLLKEANRKTPQISKKVAQNIGLVLQTPLDPIFRDTKDRKAQEKAFIKMYLLYSKKKRNLLEEMLIPFIGNDRGYKNNFDALSPHAKMHFAILAQILTEQRKKPLLPYKTPKLCADAALHNIKKLSTGDLVEFLKIFDKNNKFTDIYLSVIKKIVKGTKIDKYKAGAQLAELYSLLKSQKKDIIRNIKLNLSKLSCEEQLNFIKEIQNDKF